jgi:hypothetical protein
MEHLELFVREAAWSSIIYTFSPIGWERSLKLYLATNFNFNNDRIFLIEDKVGNG